MTSYAYIIENLHCVKFTDCLFMVISSHCGFLMMYHENYSVHCIYLHMNAPYSG